MGTAWELIYVLWRATRTIGAGSPPSWIRRRWEGTTMSLTKVAMLGGAHRHLHLQNDGDRRGQDPSGSNISLEEEDDDYGYGTPTGAPSLTAMV
jgi:hypothetical protein